ncbi:unnamed protein product, partial [Pylaiella littoralis]
MLGADGPRVVHGPAALILTKNVKYVAAIEKVAAAEKKIFVHTKQRIMMETEHLGQLNTGTLRHFARQESGPTTYLSPCASSKGENASTKRKCAACAAQVLINTACLRAFFFYVVIGTNMLESFNGSSIAAMVSKRSDFYISHVGRAQLALYKRCFPGGYSEVVS